MIKEPYYKQHPELSRSTYVTWCDNCKDTAFQMVDKKTQDSLYICARCGKKLGGKKNAYR